jgi:hypothetical protein
MHFIHDGCDKFTCFRCFSILQHTVETSDLMGTKDNLNLNLPREGAEGRGGGGGPTNIHTKL